MLEKQAQQQQIDLYYGDATKVSERAYVPYGWQFDEETVSIPSCRGYALNCFGLVNRANEFFYQLTEQNITAQMVLDFLADFAEKIDRPSVVVLDNASSNTAKKIKNRLAFWAEKGLYIFYLPPYSPQLNIIERLWKELKEGWLKPADYQSASTLKDAMKRICEAIGKDLFMDFQPCSFS